MRRATLSILQCPRCRQGTLAPRTDVPEVVFGPVQCTDCATSFPVAEGIVDLVGNSTAQGPVHRSLHHTLVARSFERYVRPAMGLFLSRRRLDRESEGLLYRSLLGSVTGPLLDLCCGTGVFSRRLARGNVAPAIIGLDVSKAMLEEATAQSREAGVTVDYVRAVAPELPFRNQSLGAVLQAASVHFIEDLGLLLREVARTLAPKGRFIASTYAAPRAPGDFMQRQLGLFPRSEEQLKDACSEAGLVGFERIRVPPLLVIKAEKP